MTTAQTIQPTRRPKASATLLGGRLAGAAAGTYRKGRTMKLINGKKVKITEAGYLYVDGQKISLIALTPLHVPDVRITGDLDITLYALKWAGRHYKMVQV